MKTRSRLLAAVCITWAAATVISGVIVFLSDRYNALGFWVGSAIVLAPQAWLALKVGRHLHGNQLVWMALQKYTMTGVGFALWFAFSTRPAPGYVLASAGLALVGTPMVLAAMNGLEINRKG
ncbi:hypothetical protein [Luminiphilus syltensis]|uniref:hypothetical protein n=1 Tax=Luminiphilus syltensis TaxID=1341119 RepID=UPI0012B5EA0D|nr:hypothetical protein [Luminiphilus syltensis]